MVSSGRSKKAKPFARARSGRSMRTATRSPPLGPKTVRNKRVRLNSGKDLSTLPITASVNLEPNPRIGKRNNFLFADCEPRVTFADAEVLARDQHRRTEHARVPGQLSLPLGFWADSSGGDHFTLADGICVQRRGRGGLLAEADDFV